jgi:hypothetical protein
MALLPLMHNLVDHIEAERWRNAHTDAVSWKRHQSVKSQLQYLVHWKPTIKEQWSLDAHMELGYTTLECTPVTFDQLLDPEPHTRGRDIHEDLFERLTCELCESHESPADMLICDNCSRMYHTGCMGVVAEDAPKPADPWKCECCQHRGGAPQRQLYKVRWQPHWEPAESVPDPLVDKYRCHCQRVNEARRHRPRAKPALAGTGKANLQNQGVFRGPRFKGSLESATGGLLKITHQPLNPHTDIAATRRFVVEVRTVHTRVPGTKSRPAEDATYKAACVYGPDGRCIGQVEPARLHTLYANFHKVRLSNPGVCTKLGCSSFEEEMYRLLLRYKRCAGKEGGHHRYATWATPCEVEGVLVRHLKVSKARVASPLTYDVRVKRYWSAYERDQLFGASWDAFSCKWTGYSGCSLDFAHRNMEKAVRWAVHSAASTSEPVATTLILPDWSLDSDTAYRRWLQVAPSYCHVLATINKKCFRFRDSDAWRGLPAHHDHPPWCLAVVVVANEQDFQALHTDLDYAAFKTDLEASISGIKDPKCRDAGVGHTHRRPSRPCGTGACSPTVAATRT